MSGSLLPNITFSALNNPLYAAFGSGGGGSNTPNPAFSTVTVEGPIRVFPLAGDAVSQFYVSTLGAGPTIQLQHISSTNGYIGLSNVDNLGVGVSRFEMYDLGNGSESGLVRYDGLAQTSQIKFLSSIGGGAPGVSINDGVASTNFTNGSTIMTNLQTTTINGAAYPPAAGFPIVRVGPSNDTAGSWSLPTGGTPVQISQNFALTAGHTYRVSAFLNCLNGEAGTTNTSGGVFTGDTGSPFLLYNQQNAILTPANNGAATTYVALVKSTAGGNGSIIMVNNGTTTLTTISQSIPTEGFLVEDLGTGLF